MSVIDLQRSSRNLLEGLVYDASYPLWRQAHSVFVLSTGRTGTDTLRHLLALSEKVDAFHEPRPQLMLERKQARWEIGLNPNRYKKIFIHARGKRLLLSYARRKIYGETSARLTFFAPIIAELLPNARFIYIHRHPADVIRSGMRRGWFKDHPADHARIEPVLGEPAYEAWSRWDQFKKICWYWDSYNRFSLNVRQQIGEDRLLTVRCDDIFSGQAIPRIFQHIGLRPPSKARVSQVLACQHNAQHKANFASLEDWTDDMREVLSDMAGKTMTTLGYPEVSRCIHERVDL